MAWLTKKCMAISSITFFTVVLNNIIWNSYCANQFGVRNNTIHILKYINTLSIVKEKSLLRILI